MTKKTKHTFTKSTATTPTQPDSAQDLLLTEDIPSQPKPSRKILIILAAISLLVTGTLIIFFAVIYWFLSSFTQAANISFSNLNQLVQTVAKTPAQSGQQNLLILGLDQITGQKDDSMLTDTIMIVHLNYDQQSIQLIPIPRDLWIDAYKTKVNALYYYGEKSPETTGKDFAAETISEITGLAIDHTVVVKLDTLKHLIDIVGGVEINVPHEFSDDKFPRSDVDVTTVFDEDLLYETISFKQGVQTMDGTNALKYIRTRASSDLAEGNDLARSFRQTQLVDSLIAKLSQQSIYTNPRTIGSIYQLYSQDLEPHLGLEQAASIAKTYLSNFPKPSTITIPVQTETEPGLLINPPVKLYGQWVYEPKDPTWEELQQFISSSLQ